jgi:hypothetical protein
MPLEHCVECCTLQHKFRLELLRRYQLLVSNDVQIVYFLNAFNHDGILNISARRNYARTVQRTQRVGKPAFLDPPEKGAIGPRVFTAAGAFCTFALLERAALAADSAIQPNRCHERNPRVRIATQ